MKLMATRLPVEKVIRHSLPWPADASAPSMQRVALEAVLQAPRGPLRVIVTHLEFYSLSQRLAQVDELRRLQREAADHARHPAPAENATGPGFVDAWTFLHPGRTPPPTAGVYDKAQWSSGAIPCDFVFVTADLCDRLVRCEIDGATQASDHQPIVLELR